MKRISKKIEVIFTICYLSFALVCGIYLLGNGTQTAALLAGAMALILAGGDTFHLLPRLLVIVSGKEERYQTALGRGKQITSITMTIFYILLWQIALQLFPMSYGYSGMIYVLSTVRIVLCLLPQNQWTQKNPPLAWGIIRNIPFVITGILIALPYGWYAGNIGSLQGMWIAILISFFCYLPVVLAAHKYPMVGMLMLPKTCAYMWILWMCLSFVS